MLGHGVGVIICGSAVCLENADGCWTVFWVKRFPLQEVLVGNMETWELGCCSTTLPLLVVLMSGRVKNDHLSVAHRLFQHFSE